jgi:FkbM family methyltransferase
MSTLVYVGANEGVSLWHIFNQFDEVHVFEPDPEIFEKLNKKYKQFEWVNLVNAACSTEDGESSFFITNNRVASSLGCGSEVFQGFGEYNKVVREIKVKTINLQKYLEDAGVEEIDLYSSDCQGSDLTVLKTIKNFLDAKKIKEIFTETHGNGRLLYEGLDNQFDGFKEVLSENYDFIHASLGCHNGKIVEEKDIPEEDPEFDSYWRLKDSEPGVGSLLKA